jgi:LysM repeat protein
MNNRYFDSNSEKIPEEEYLEDQSYRTLKEKKPLPRGWLIVAPLLVGIVIVFMLAVWFRGNPQEEQAGSQIRQLEERVGNLEKRLVELNTIDEKMRALEKDGQAYLQAIERLNRLETAMSMRLDELTKTPVAKPSPPAAERPKEKQSPKTVVGSAKTVTHVVQAGDTLYGISRKYNVPIDQLRRANDLGQSSTIRPGQKLTVKQSSSD